MRRALGTTVAAILALILLIPEWRAYQAEAALLKANLLMNAALTGQLPEQQPLQAVEQLIVLARQARAGLPADPRPVLAEGMGLLMLSRLDEAEQVFVDAIRLGERPEILVNYGRVLAARGDHDGAHAAMLRAAWIAPGSIQTLPRAMRETLDTEIQAYERGFRAGNPSGPPPWPERLRHRLSKP